MPYEIPLILQLIVVLGVASLTVIVGRRAKMITRSLVPGKEPLTYLWLAFIIATFVVYVFFPEYFFLNPYVDVGLELLLVVLLAMVLMYPIGYHFGFIYIINLTEYTFDEKGQEFIITTPHVYYWRKQKDGASQLCYQEQGIFATCKTLLGIHNTLTLPFDKIKRRYYVSTRSTYLKARAPLSASCRHHGRDPYTFKKWFITWNVRHHTFVIGDHNTVDPIDYAVSTTVIKKATETTEALNAQIAGLEISRSEDRLKAGVKILRNIRGLRLDEDIRQQITKDIEAEDGRRKEIEKEEALRRLRAVNAVPIPQNKPPEGGGSA